MPPKFDGFTSEKLITDPDERTQIAFRLAHQLGHKSVYGIDEQSMTIDYFPFDKVETYAKAHEQGAALSRMQEKVGEMMKQMEIAQPGDRVLVVFGSGHAFWLRHFVQNTPGFQLIEPRDYLQ